MTPQTEAKTESRWLLRLLDWLFAAGLLAVAAVALVDDWPIGRLGNAYQLFGLLFAALAIPVLSPGLAWMEARISDGKAALKRWIRKRKEQIKRLWARIVRNERTAALSGTASARVSMSGTLSIKSPSVDRETISERDWLAFLNDQLDAIREQVRELQSGRLDDRNEVNQKLEALRVELQEHTLAVTQDGWAYVATGAWLTGLGIFLTLF